jgi:hypothetical protein
VSGNVTQRALIAMDSSLFDWKSGIKASVFCQPDTANAYAAAAAGGVTGSPMTCLWAVRSRVARGWGYYDVRADGCAGVA